MPAYVRTELQQGAFAVVWLEREPVNLMDLALWQQLAAALEQLEANPVRRQLRSDFPCELTACMQGCLVQGAAG